MKTFLHFVATMRGVHTVQVILTGNAAWVRVMDDANFGLYQSGLKYNYYGGYYTHNPVQIRPPGGGKWNVVIDLDGMAGHLSATVQVV